MSPATAAVASSSSSARQILQRRAIQCSFSSVFHLRNTVINNSTTDTKQAAAAAMKQVKDVERIFITAVALPVYFMGFVGALAYGHKTWK